MDHSLPRDKLYEDKNFFVSREGMWGAFYTSFGWVSADISFQRLGRGKDAGPNTKVGARGTKVKKEGKERRLKEKG